MASLGWHTNAWRDGAKASVLAAPGPLLILNTALDTGIVAGWRAKTPARLLYRHVYQGSDPGDHDVQGRCDLLSREAEPLLPFGVVVLAPWNEERQDTSLLSAYADDTVRAVNILRSRGFKVGVGNFGVCWPKPEDAHLFLPAIRVADFYSRHAYAAPTLTSEWDRLIGHAYADAQTVFTATGKTTEMTEFGIDWGVLGFTLDGWRSHGGIPATDYAYQLAGQAARAPACIDTLYIYCCGQFGDWKTFDVAGETEIEKAVRLFSAQWGGDPMPLAEQFPKEYAAWVAAGGLDNNFLPHLIGIGAVKPTLGHIPLLIGNVAAAAKTLEAAYPKAKAG